jgi:hypothetical protein
VRPTATTKADKRPCRAWSGGKHPPTGFIVPYSSRCTNGTSMCTSGQVCGSARRALRATPHAPLSPLSPLPPLQPPRNKTGNLLVLPGCTIGCKECTGNDPNFDHCPDTGGRRRVAETPGPKPDSGACLPHHQPAHRGRVRAELLPLQPVRAPAQPPVESIVDRIPEEVICGPTRAGPRAGAGVRPVRHGGGLHRAALQRRRVQRHPVRESGRPW